MLRFGVGDRRRFGEGDRRRFGDGDRRFGEGDFRDDLGVYLSGLLLRSRFAGLLLGARLRLSLGGDRLRLRKALFNDSGQNFQTIDTKYLPQFVVQ